MTLQLEGSVWVWGYVSPADDGKDTVATSVLVKCNSE